VNRILGTAGRQGWGGYLILLFGRRSGIMDNTGLKGEQETGYHR
jgi:hypothetical protein